MSIPDFDELNEPLARAMASAIYLIAEMDYSVDWGCAKVVPEEIVQTLVKLAPTLLSEVTQCNLQNELLARIADYEHLRQLAPPWLDLEAYLESREDVSFEDILFVLDAEGWSASHPSIHSLLMSIAPVVEEKLFDRFAIPW
jgi:hypothetical protein